MHTPGMVDGKPGVQAADHAAAAPPARLNTLSRQMLANADVLGKPADCRRLARQTMQQAVLGAGDGKGTCIQLGEGHNNIGGLPVFNHLLTEAKSPDGKKARIKTIMFEYPPGNEELLARGMEKVSRQIAETPGGAKAYFNELPREESAGAKWFYMMDRATKMGFNIECIDSTSGDFDTRNETMTQKIRAKTDAGEGVIVVNGAKHLGVMQNMMLNGQEKKGGQSLHRPINAVSLALVDSQYPKETNQMLADYASHRLPPARAQLVRFENGMEDKV
ncbi:MAG: hypothetical protein EOO28_05745 [Comamonadaceae bacterium]|nr:MAG: hypothetical protein EOO28_05745 [Comamonadaceae bacterium]